MVDESSVGKGTKTSKSEVMGPDYDKFYKDRGQVEVTETFPQEHYLWNEDFHPTPVGMRKWGAATYGAIWVGMAVIVPTLTLATAGMALGLNWGTTLILMFLGNLIVLIPTLIQSHGGARYGMSEPQLTRTRWGIYGAQIPSWVRTVISMGWWGVESFIIAEAAVYLYLMGTGQNLLAIFNAGHMGPGALPYAYPTVFWVTFFLVILAQIVIFYFSPPVKGQQPLKWLARIASPIMVVAFILMFFEWTHTANYDVSPITSYPASVTGTAYWLAVCAFLNSNVAYWATMAVSMPDYTRFAKSQFSQTVGQIPMPFIMVSVGAMGIFGAGAAMANGWLNVPIANPLAFYGFDPVQITATFVYAPIAVFILLALMLATFTVNVFANSVAPGYDIANTYSKHLTWFRGILIGIVISIVVGAYNAYSANVHSYIYNWLLAYGALLGAVEGVVVFDYAILRRFKFNSTDVFRKKGKYYFLYGVNPAAVIAFVVAVVVTYIFKWHISGAIWAQFLYNNSWIVAFFIAGVIDVILNVLWIFPKYAKDLKGNLKTGYIDDETREMFASGGK